MKSKLQISFIGVFLGIGMLLGAILAFQDNRKIDKAQFWVSAQAYVEDATTYKNRRGRLKAAIKYNYIYEGKKYHSDNVGWYTSEDLKTIFPSPNIFERNITCYVNSTNPAESVLFRNQSHVPNWVLVVIGSIGAVLLFFVAVNGDRDFREPGRKKCVR